MSTYGGSPDGAYRIARTLRRLYGEFTAYIFGACKSAGTLITIGATEIVMTDFGELGPLDIQLPKVDELDNESGLVYRQALDALKEHSFDVFERCYLEIKRKSGGSISTKTASAIATDLATGTISPIAAQIDPLKIGETSRALAITYAYGSRLTDNTEALEILISGYPSHGFVIDYEEAKDLLGNVRPMTQEEDAAIGQLKNLLRHPHDQLIVAILDEFLDDAVAQNQKGEGDDTAVQRPSETSDPGAIQENEGGHPEGHPEELDQPALVVIAEEISPELNQTQGLGKVDTSAP